VIHKFPLRKFGDVFSIFQPLGTHYCEEPLIYFKIFLMMLNCLAGCGYFPLIKVGRLLQLQTFSLFLFNLKIL